MDQETAANLEIYSQRTGPGYTVAPGYVPPTGKYAMMQEMQPTQDPEKKNCEDWRCGKGILGACLPLLIFVILAIISLVINLFTPGTGGSKVVALIVTMFWYIFWGFIIYLLCRMGHPGWAWAVLFLPLIVWAILAMLVFFGIIKLDQQS